MRPPSGVVPHFSHTNFKTTLEAKLAGALPEFHLPEAINDLVLFDDLGFPSLQLEAVSGCVYIDTLEQLMVCLVTWAGELADRAQNFREQAALADAEAGFSERRAFFDANARSVRDRELIARQDASVLATQFDARICHALHERFEQSAKRLDKHVDTLKYLHRGLAAREHRTNTVVT